MICVAYQRSRGRNAIGRDLSAAQQNVEKRGYRMNTKVKKIKRYGLPVLTAWAWRQVGKVLLLAALVAVAAVTMGEVTP